ncbi:MAG: hypothetical protein AB7V13_30045 [Pseudorhodoplanes sp.]
MSIRIGESKADRLGLKASPSILKLQDEQGAVIRERRGTPAPGPSL